MQIINGPLGVLKIEDAEKAHPIGQSVKALLTMMPLQKGMTVLDLGTGAGICAIYAAQAGCKVLGTDITTDILKIAEKNAQLNGINSIEWQLATYFDGIGARKFDLIVANMPQTPAPKMMRLDKWGGEFGCLHSEKILRSAVSYLKPDGILMMTQISLSFPSYLNQIAAQHYKIELKKELKRKITKEEYEQYQVGLWDYLMKLEKEGKSEICREEKNFFFYSRIYQYQLK